MYWVMKYLQRLMGGAAPLGNSRVQLSIAFDGRFQSSKKSLSRGKPVSSVPNGAG